MKLVHEALELKKDIEPSIDMESYAEKLKNENLAREFIETTYPSETLTDTAMKTLKALSGESGEVFGFHTGLGGGKSHIMAAVLALVYNPSLIPYAASKWDHILPKLTKPKATIIIDGSKINPMPRGSERPVTLLELLAKKSGEDDLLKGIVSSYNERFKKNMFPGPVPADDIDWFLRTLVKKYGGLLIIVDELSILLGRYSSLVTYGKEMLTHTIDSIDTLFRGVAKSSGCAFIFASAPYPHFSKESEIAEDLARRVSKELKRVPITTEELIHVTMSKLFGVKLNEIEDVVNGVAELYHNNVYDALLKGRGLVKTREEVREGITSSYPFTPAMWDFIKTKLASMEKFQRTRDVIRVANEICKHVWNSSPDDVHLIHHYHAPRTLLKDIVSFSDPDRSIAWDNVIQLDIEGNASKLDTEEKTQIPIHRYVAYTIFMESHVPEGAKHIIRGMNKRGLYETTLSPVLITEKGITIDHIDKVLDNFWRLWYLHPQEIEKGEIYYYFDVVPTVVKEVEEERKNVKLVDALKRIDDMLAISEPQGVKVLSFNNESEISDTISGKGKKLPEDPSTRIVIIKHTVLRDVAQRIARSLRLEDDPCDVVLKKTSAPSDKVENLERSIRNEMRKMIEQILNPQGVSCPAGVVALAPTNTLSYAQFEDAVKWVVAVGKVKEKYDMYKQDERYKEILNRLEVIYQKYESESFRLIPDVYNTIFFVEQGSPLKISERSGQPYGLGGLAKLDLTRRALDIATSNNVITDEPGALSTIIRSLIKSRAEATPNPREFSEDTYVLYTDMFRNAWHPLPRTLLTFVDALRNVSGQSIPVKDKNYQAIIYDKETGEKVLTGMITLDGILNRKLGIRLEEIEIIITPPEERKREGLPEEIAEELSRMYEVLYGVNIAFKYSQEELSMDELNDVFSFLDELSRAGVVGDIDMSIDSSIRARGKEGELKIEASLPLELIFDIQSILSGVSITDIKLRKDLAANLTGEANVDALSDAFKSKLHFIKWVKITWTNERLKG